MNKYGMMALVVLAIGCGDDESTSNNASTNNASTNNASTNNASTNNASTNNASTNNASTNNASTNNASTNNTSTNNTMLPDPFVAQLVFRRVATENCQLSGCVKSETVNFASGTFSNQDGRQVVLPTDDGKYQALGVEAQREAFITSLTTDTFDCSTSVSPEGTTYEFEGFVRENGQAKTHRANITGCVVDAQQDVQIVVGLFAELKTAFLP